VGKREREREIEREEGASGTVMKKSAKPAPEALEEIGGRGGESRRRRRRLSPVPIAATTSVRSARKEGRLVQCAS
jgi:general stress protein YciG